MEVSNRENRLLEMFKRVLRCSAARLSKPCGKLFLIVGDVRHSAGEWYRNGVPMSFNYVDEKCVASGDSEAELLASVRRYKRLCWMTWEKNTNEILEMLKR